MDLVSQEHLPKLIVDYYSEGLRINISSLNSLKVLCIIKLINYHINDNYEVDEALDVFNAGGIIVSYFKINQLCQELNIRHIEELFEQLILICTNLLETKVKDQIDNLSKIGKLVKCNNYKKMLLLPTNDYYYAVCDVCGTKRINSYKMETFFCCNSYHQYSKVLNDQIAKINEDNKTILIYKNNSPLGNNNNPEAQSNVKICCFRIIDSYYHYTDNYQIYYDYYCSNNNCWYLYQDELDYNIVLRLFNKYKSKYQS